MSSKTMLTIAAVGFVAVVLGCGSVPPSETPASEIARPTAHDVQVAASADDRQLDIELVENEIIELTDDPEGEGRTSRNRCRRYQCRSRLPLFPRFWQPKSII